MAIFAATAWARWMHTPTWVYVLVATPAVLIGGLTIFSGNTLLPHFSALVGLPVGIAGLISGLILARPFPDRGPTPFRYVPQPCLASDPDGPEADRGPRRGVRDARAPA